MAIEYLAMGSALENDDPAQLQYEDSKRLLVACQQHPDFEVIELRRVEIGGRAGQATEILDGIVVDCCDGTVPSRNDVGIKPRERLLLLHAPDRPIRHDVRALRPDFPTTPHQNHVPAGTPASLCLYFEPWSAVERSWTPAHHLQRILWWLRCTALGTLHRSDQPLERLYFVSPFKVILPADFSRRAENKAEVMALQAVSAGPTSTICRGIFHPAGNARQRDDRLDVDLLVITVPQVIAGPIERYPGTLGALHDQLVARGSALHPFLIDEIKSHIPESGLQIQSGGRGTLLLIQLPVARDAQSAPERTDVMGFIVHALSLAKLSIACGAGMDGRDGKAYVNHVIAVEHVDTTANHDALGWRASTIEPIDVRFALSSQTVRRLSGLTEEYAEIRGVLAGLGALGSCMATIWQREAWGAWVYIDDDIVFPHNLVRHVAQDRHIGYPKVDVVVEAAALTWSAASQPIAVTDNVTSLSNADVQNAIADATLLVDATTTLEVPRDLSSLSEVPRMVSVFLTPSGTSSVLLLEDADRQTRLHAIEPQYYRALLDSDWGTTHLAGHRGSYWVGAGCRDLSGVLPQELVSLHGATLARQVRLLSAKPDAQIRVWSVDEESGAMSAHLAIVQPTRETKAGKWRVIWDEGLASKLFELRAQSLPNETGGVILGYVDQKQAAIYIVAGRPAPVDSVSSPTGFTRGVQGVQDDVERVGELSAHIVHYLGEWHSHPRHLSARPSPTDGRLIGQLAKALMADGMPALMVIAGEGDISVTVEDGGI